MTKKRGKIIFKGNFIEFCIFNIIFFLLGFITLGIFWIYLPYWSVKYFVANLEIEMYEVESSDQVGATIIDN